jgi:DNA-binding response OmpR family regulator
MTTILLVDAPHGQAAVLASALRVEGLDVLHASTAGEARRVLAQEPVAVAVIDLMIRGDGASNGLELARELRAAFPLMRVLLTSAYHLSERQLERADCGVSGFIPKPYDVAEVVDFIRTKATAPPSSRRLWHAEPSSGVVGVVDALVAARAKR